MYLKDRCRHDKTYLEWGGGLASTQQQPRKKNVVETLDFTPGEKSVNKRKR